MKEVHVSAPGSLMLLGEHAVLDGNQAVISAINRRIHVSLLPIHNHRILKIESRLGEYESNLDNLNEDNRFRFILKAVHLTADKLRTGIHLKIHSDFPSSIGFGSSTAVTVAVHAALEKYIKGEIPDSLSLFHSSLNTIRHTQKWASGADVAASVYGGLIGYMNEGNSLLSEQDPTNPSITFTNQRIPMTAVFCGYKKPTHEVINEVIFKQTTSHSDILKKFKFSEINSIAKKGLEALQKNKLAVFGDHMNQQQKIMYDVGLSTSELDEIYNTLIKDSAISGAKISGAGLGDCVVAIGHPSEEEGDIHETILLNKTYPLYKLHVETIGCSETNL